MVYWFFKNSMIDAIIRVLNITSLVVSNILLIINQERPLNVSKTEKIRHCFKMNN